LQQQQKKYISAALVVLALGMLVLQPARTSAQLSPNENSSSNASSSLSGKDNNSAALNSTQATTNASNRFSLQSFKVEGAPILGGESAPVIITDFSDFQCPRCERHVQSTEPEIKKEYIETGNVAYVFKHFPWRGTDSFSAALASECANEQGKFWEYHDVLFQNQQGVDSGWASIEKLKEFASAIGLDRQQFDSCLDSEKYKSNIDRDLALVEELGLDTTPSFLILNSNGTEMEVLEGAHPFPSFKALIDKRLS
jgi:protein-disulfide isomerase